MDTTALDEARAEAKEYNKTLVTIPEKPYTKDALIKAAESYDTLLNVREDGLMGYVEIPAIGVNLPIYHGTEESTAWGICLAPLSRWAAQTPIVF